MADYNRRLRDLVSESRDATETLEIINQYKIIDSDTFYNVLDLYENLTYKLGKIIFEIESAEELKPTESNLEPLSSAELEAIKKKNKKHVVDDLYCFSKISDGYRLVIPYLLNRRSERTKRFHIRQRYVYSVCERLLSDNEDSIVQFAEATVLFVLHAPPEYTSTRDSDNSDSRDIINLVNRYMISTDDSGNYLNIMFDSKTDNEYFTEVFIFPRKDLASLLTSELLGNK